VAGFFRRSARSSEAAAAGYPSPRAAAGPSVASSPEAVLTSKVFPRFLAALAPHASPVLLDLGPVVGPNVGFFGERLACKIHVENLIADIEAHARRGERDRLVEFLRTRLTQPDESIDGILCWDVFDCLNRRAGQVLAGHLARLLRPGGALYGFFGASNVELTSFSRFTIDAADRLRVRQVPMTPVRRDVLPTRDIIKMFNGLVVTESVLLKSNTRETLFRKI
jgi:hypothetical protein